MMTREHSTRKRKAEDTLSGGEADSNCAEHGSIGGEVNSNCAEHGSIYSGEVDSNCAEHGSIGSEAPIPNSSPRPYPDELYHFGPYLNHATKQACRLVCRDWKEAIDAYPALYKQRQHFYRLYINHEPQPVVPKGRKSWLDLDAVRHCCEEELKPIAEAMEGTRFNPTARAEELFAVTLRRKYHTAAIVLFFANRFTPLSAFHYLHFLKHLGGCVIEDVLIDSGSHVSFLTALPSTVRCRSLVIKKQEWTDFNNVFEFFRIHDVSSIFPEVKLGIQGDWDAWPRMALFNSREATHIEESRMSNAVFRKSVFVYRNQKSGKFFLIEVEAVEMDGRGTWVTGVSLYLGGGE